MEQTLIKNCSYLKQRKFAFNVQCPAQETETDFHDVVYLCPVLFVIVDQLFSPAARLSKRFNNLDCCPTLRTPVCGRLEFIDAEGNEATTSYAAAEGETATK